MRAELEAAFEEFVVAASPGLFRAAYAIARDRQIAEDAVQSALVKACVRWRRIAATEDPGAYVRRMVVNEVLSWRRRRASTERPVAEPEGGATASHETAVTESDAMWRALGRLAPRQRAVVVLRYYEHLTEAEIATALDIRPGTVKSQAAAALANLRRFLTPTDAPEGERV